MERRERKGSRMRNWLALLLMAAAALAAGRTHATPAAVQDAVAAIRTY